jgi:hypothetical protein
MPTMASPLPDDPSTLKAMLIAERARARRLEEIIKAMQRHRFGRRAETLSEDQLLLGLEDVGLSGFLCVVGHKGEEGDPLCPDAKSHRYRMNFLTSFWPAVLPARPLSKAACSTP